VHLKREFMMRPSRAGLSGAALVLAAVLPVNAQIRPAGEGFPPGWLSLQNDFEALRGYTASDRADALRTAMAIQAVFLKVPFLQRLDRVEVGGRVVWRADRPSRERLFSWDYTLRFWSPSFQVSSEIVRSIDVTVNPYPDLLAGGWALASKDSDTPEGAIWAERPRFPLLPGMPPGTVVYDRLVADTPSYTQVLLVPRGASPMIPVSRERFLKSEIARYRESDEILANAASQSAWERWMADAPRRKEIRDGTVAGVAATDPAQAAKLKEELEQVERETGERLKAQEASERAWIGKLAAQPTLRQKLIAQMEAMSPAERALPAALDPAKSGTWEMIPPDTPGGQHLVTLNPAFYSSRGSPR
jgi:hypothetical protein